MVADFYMCVRVGHEDLNALMKVRDFLSSCGCSVGTVHRGHEVSIMNRRRRLQNILKVLRSKGRLSTGSLYHSLRMKSLYRLSIRALSRDIAFLYVSGFVEVEKTGGGPLGNTTFVAPIVGVVADEVL